MSGQSESVANACRNGGIDVGFPVTDITSRDKLHMFWNKNARQKKEHPHQSCGCSEGTTYYVLSFTEDFREFLINVITTNITGNDFPVGGKDDGVWKGKDTVCF